MKMKTGFDTDQLISSTEVVRNFSKIRIKAKESPLLILDKNIPDSVLLSVQEYNNFVQVIEDLSEEIFNLKVIDRIKEMEREGYKTLTFDEVATPELMALAKEVENMDISDQELFE